MALNPRLDFTTPPIALLEHLGPDAPAGPAISHAEALEYCRGLTVSHYENFSVLSALVPLELRDDFAAVYAFCRWADDLGDETGQDEAARTRSLTLLAWWGDQTRGCWAGSATHPVFVALAHTASTRGLPIQPFLDLIDAFEQDQRLRHYERWDQLLDYCRRSANPVGRIVLHLGGYPDSPANADRYRMSDATCTALQLTNFWQDVRRDLLERDRVYLPSHEFGHGPDQLRAWLDRAYDPAARVPFIRGMRPLTEMTRELFDQGAGLPQALDARIGPLVGLFGTGGRAVLRSVERMGGATLWARPRLGKSTKALLVARAFLAARLGLRL